MPKINFHQQANYGIGIDLSGWDKSVSADPMNQAYVAAAPLFRMDDFEDARVQVKREEEDVFDDLLFLGGDEQPSPAELSASSLSPLPWSDDTFMQYPCISPTALQQHTPPVSPSLYQPRALPTAPNWKAECDYLDIPCLQSPHTPRCRKQKAPSTTSLSTSSPSKAVHVKRGSHARTVSGKRRVREMARTDEDGFCNFSPQDRNYILSGVASSGSTYQSRRKSVCT